MTKEFEAADFHAEWLELCALETTGTLEPPEQDKLSRHLEGCAHCRAAFDEFQSVAHHELPIVAGDYFALNDDATELPRELSQWNQAAEAQKLLARFDREPRVPRLRHLPVAPARRPAFGAIALWAGIAAGIVIAVCPFLRLLTAGRKRNSFTVATHS